MTRLCDLGLGVVLPFHAHVGMNAVISDYIPYAYRSAPLSLVELCSLQLRQSTLWGQPPGKLPLCLNDLEATGCP